MICRDVQHLGVKQTLTPDIVKNPLTTAGDLRQVVRADSSHTQDVVAGGDRHTQPKRHIDRGSADLFGRSAIGMSFPSPTLLALRRDGGAWEHKPQRRQKRWGTRCKSNVTSRQLVRMHTHLWRSIRPHPRFGIPMGQLCSSWTLARFLKTGARLRRT